MRTLFLCLLCIGCVACAVLDCHDRSDARKVMRHAVAGLAVALAIWWVLAYRIEIFARN